MKVNLKVVKNGYWAKNYCVQAGIGGIFFIQTPRTHFMRINRQNVPKVILEAISNTQPKPNWSNPDH